MNDIKQLETPEQKEAKAWIRGACLGSFATAALALSAVVYFFDPYDWHEFNEAKPGEGVENLVRTKPVKKDNASIVQKSLTPDLLKQLRVMKKTLGCEEQKPIPLRSRLDGATEALDLIEQPVWIDQGLWSHYTRKLEQGGGQVSEKSIFGLSNDGFRVDRSREAGIKEYFEQYTDQKNIAILIEGRSSFDKPGDPPGAHMRNSLLRAIYIGEIAERALIEPERICLHFSGAKHANNDKYSSQSAHITVFDYTQ